MTAVGESESALASKCLDLCQTLMSQGLAFKFSLTVGSSFAFSLDTSPSLDTKGKEPVKKKPKPSTLRRNARRRDEFLKKKQAPLLESSATDTAKAKITARPLKHLPSPTAPSQSRQVITVGRNSASPSFSQLDASSLTHCLLHTFTRTLTHTRSHTHAHTHTHTHTHTFSFPAQ